jgi:hypothetical protein
MEIIDKEENRIHGNIIHPEYLFGSMLWFYNCTTDDEYANERYEYYKNVILETKRDVEKKLMVCGKSNYGWNKDELFYLAGVRLILFINNPHDIDRVWIIKTLNRHLKKMNYTKYCRFAYEVQKYDIILMKYKKVKYFSGKKCPCCDDSSAPLLYQCKVCKKMVCDECWLSCDKCDCFCIHCMGEFCYDSDRF